MYRREEILKISNQEWISTTREAQSKDPNAVVLFCHGLTGDKIGPQRLITNLASHLAIHCSVEVVRFDFRGSGLSSGVFADTSFKTMEEDALSIASYQNRPLIWMGISTGAIIALMASAHRNRKEPVIAISNGLAERALFVRANQDLVSLHGGKFFLSQNFFNERAALRLRSDYFPKAGPVTIVIGSEDEKHYKETDSLAKYDVQLFIINGGDHLYTNPDNRSQLYRFVEDKVNEVI